MKWIKCDNCGKRYDAGAHDFCPRCGRRAPRTETGGNTGHFQFTEPPAQEPDRPPVEPPGAAASRRGGVLVLRLLIVLGLAVCALGGLLPLPGYLLALVIGLGNSLFHVAGGTVTLKGAKDAGPLGVFVAPGAVGLALGTLWPGLRLWLCAAALVTAAQTISLPASA